MTISPVPGDWVPQSCTLPTAEQPLRVAEFDGFFAGSVRSVHRPGPARLELVFDDEAASAARELVARESSCCTLFTFEFATVAGSSVLRVSVPDERIEVLDAFASRAQAGCGGVR